MNDHDPEFDPTPTPTDTPPVDPTDPTDPEPDDDDDNPTPDGTPPGPTDTPPVDPALGRPLPSVVPPLAPEREGPRPTYTIPGTGPYSRPAFAADADTRAARTFERPTDTWAPTQTQTQTPERPPADDVPSAVAAQPQAGSDRPAAGRTHLHVLEDHDEAARRHGDRLREKAANDPASQPRVADGHEWEVQPAGT